MMLTTWLSFLGTSLVFGLIPGPSVCFTLGHTIKYGIRRTWPTILGQLTANVYQIIIVLFGLHSILVQSIFFFQGLKIGGIFYLVYLGYRQWTAGKPGINIHEETGSKTRRQAFKNGFIICATNPKAIFYYAALLPQFVLPGEDKNIQLFILAIISIVISGLVLAFYTVLANKVRDWLDNNKLWRIQNRLTGSFMIVAAILLSLASRE